MIRAAFKAQHNMANRERCLADTGPARRRQHAPGAAEHPFSAREPP